MSLAIGIHLNAEEVRVNRSIEKKYCDLLRVGLEVLNQRENTTCVPVRFRIGDDHRQSVFWVKSQKSARISAKTNLDVLSLARKHNQVLKKIGLNKSIAVGSQVTCKKGTKSSALTIRFWA